MAQSGKEVEGNKKRMFLKKISTRLGLAMFFVAFIPLLIGGYFSYTTSRDIILNNSILKLQDDVEVDALELNLLLNSYVENLFLVANTPPIQGIIRAKDNGGIDPFDNSTYKLWIERLGTIFKADAMASSAYIQLRYIDENGDEMVRVDSDGEIVIQKAEDELQNKADRYYFTEAINLEPGQIYVSELDLNKEGDPPKIEVPYKPVLRIATPIFYEETDQVRGIVIFNIDASELLAKAINEDVVNDPDHPIAGFYIVSNEGYYYMHPDNSKEWGGVDNLGTGYNLKNDFPEDISALIFSGESGAKELEDHTYIAAYNPIYPDIKNKDNFWVLIRLIPEDVILLPIISLRNLIIIVAIGFGILAIALSIFFSRSLSRPIAKLVEVANAIGKGDLNSRFDGESDDEIGLLGMEINNMADEILFARSNLEKQVDERTKELNEKKKALEKNQRTLLETVEDLKKFQLAVDHASDQIVITDSDGIVLYANPVFEVITGYTVKEILGTKGGVMWGRLMDKKFYEDMWKTIKIDKKVFSGELTNHRKDGREYDAVTTIAPILDDNDDVKFFVAIERDVTKAKEVDRMKTEFISLVSHQMRTPLSSMKWFSEMLLSGDAGALNEKQKEFTQNISDSNDRMIALVDSLLNISRIESGRIVIDPKPTYLKELAESILAELDPQIKKKKINVILNIEDSMPKVDIDPKLIGEVYANLLTNAVKYTPDGGEITVSIAKKGNEYITQISDTGCGIPAKDHDKVFTKFFRADNARELETDGNGLGLYLIKAIVESSGGRIWFESEEGKGTTFWFTLPLKSVKKSSDIEK